MRRIRIRAGVIILAAAVLAAACSETSSTDDVTGGDDGSTTSASETTTGGDDGATTTEAGDDTTAPPTSGSGEVDLDSVVGRHAGQDWFLGTVPNAPVAADATAEPILIGLTNQENSPAGAFPEIRNAALAGVEFINAELGGVGGRPLELLTCEAVFDATVSQNCAQEHVQNGVVALVGGIDVTSNGSIPILEGNGVPQVGGIPANLEEQTSDHMFFFSGGTAGGVAAMLSHAAEQGAEKAFIAFGDFPSFSIAAEEYAVPVAEDLGLEVQLAPFNLLTTDFLPVLTDAADSGADAVIILAADTACVNVISDFEELVPGAQLYMTGACAADEIADALGDALDTVILNNEGPNGTTTGGEIYQDVVDTYATEEAGGAGTVGFRGLMNLWAALDAIGPEATSADILEYMRAAEARPSFWGHPYTCDGEQVPGLPALCAPQQTLFSFIDSDVVDVSGGWIDTVAIFERALG
ncbi:MAG: ABC transporter substrate-binding protein [Acidimicrobiales bacterium]